MTYASYLYDLRQYSYGNYCSTYVRVLQYWRRVPEQITASG